MLLLDVANGNMRQSINIYDKIERDGPHHKLVCTLNFKLVFEEFWDFLLKFLDWRTSNLTNDLRLERQNINPKIEIELDSKAAIRSSVISETLKNTKMPYWS